MSDFQGARVRVGGSAGLAGGGVTSGELATAISGLAPSNATYITQTANGTLSAEQALGSLATGILKNTTTTGVLSIATGADLPAHTSTGVPISKGFVIDGGGSTITTGVKFDILFESSMEITDIYVMGDQSGSIDIRLWVDDFASYPPVSGDNIYTLTTTTQISRHVSGLSLSVSAGDVMRINVQSVTSYQRASVALCGTRTV